MDYDKLIEQHQRAIEHLKLEKDANQYTGEEFYIIDAAIGLHHALCTIQSGCLWEREMTDGQHDWDKPEHACYLYKAKLAYALLIKYEHDLDIAGLLEIVREMRAP